MAQRALIIGLGSTGYDVVKRLIDRVQWEYGGLERTPWLEILILETEELKGNGPLERNGYRIMMPDQKFSELVNNPSSFKSQLDLDSWWHPDTLLRFSGMANKKGAGNIRMVGRLAFLYPDNLERINSMLKARLDRLGDLTDKAAGMAMTPGADGARSIPLGDTIAVYVVGTLSGGTCSGAFLDLGYLLHAMFQKHNSKIERFGIFSLPHLQLDAKNEQRRRANAFAALTELNHYMAGQPYHAQYSLFPDTPTVVQTTAPYDVTYLVQPKSGTTAAFESLKLTASQFLHSAIFTSNAGQIGARMIDGAANVVAGDKNGSPQMFYSFGVSAIEKPGYLISQGCCYRLGFEAFDEFLKPKPNAPVEAEPFRTKVLGFSTEKVAELLLQTSGAEPGTAASLRDQLVAEINSAVRSAENEGEQTSSKLLKSEQKIELAFLNRPSEGAVSDEEVESSSLPPYSVPARVRANAALIAPRLEEVLTREIQTALLDLARGPVWCSEVLQSTETWLRARIAELDNNDSASDLEKSRESANRAVRAERERIMECATSLSLKLFGGRKKAMERHLIEYRRKAEHVFKLRFGEITLGPERELWRKLLPAVVNMRTRIAGGGTDGGILEAARFVRDQFSTRFQNLDNATPEINGEAIYNPGLDIEKAYADAWSRLGAEAKARAKRQMVLAWDALPRLNEQGEILGLEAYFAPRPSVPSADDLKRQAEASVEDLAQKARQRDYFLEATRRGVLEYMAPVNEDQIRDVWDRASVLLRANKQNPVFTDMVGKNARVAFLPVGDARTRESIRTIIDRQCEGARFQAEENDDPQSLFFLQALGGFSLAIIEGFQENESQGFRYSFDQESREIMTMWSRCDVRWHPFYGDQDYTPDGRALADWRKGLFLSALALTSSGREGDELIKPKLGGFYFKPATPFGPGKDRVEFSLDLRDNAQRLREAESGEALRRLQSAVEAVRASRPLTELAAELADLYNGVEALRLFESRLSFAGKGRKEQDGQANPVDNTVTRLTPEHAQKYILAFWHRDPAMVSSLNAPFRPVAMVQHIENHRKGESPLYPFAGLYCCHSDHTTPVFLASSPGDLPARCPECGRDCR